MLIDPDECLTHNSTQCTDLEASKDVAALDVTDPDACHRFFTGADAVVHLAAVPDPAAILGAAAAGQRGGCLPGRRGRSQLRCPSAGTCQ
jgi:hypothetical protein